MTSVLNDAEPRSIGLGLVAVVLLLCAIQVTYLLWPQVKRFQDLSQSHELLRNAAAGGDGLALELQRTKDDVDRLMRRLHGDMAGLPAKQMESYIIGRLQKVSWATDVDLISVRPGTGQQVQMFQEALFDIQIHARYHDFYAWLNAISRELGFIVVKTYRIHPRDRKVEDPVLDITLTMVSYRMVPS